MYHWNRPGRKYFPDEQVSREDILRVMREHRQDAPDLPWLTLHDIGWRAGAILPRQDDYTRDMIQPWDLERRWRRMPWGYRWKHYVSERDVRTGLVALEAQGLIGRLPRYARGWAYWVAVESDQELADMVQYFADMDEARARLRYERVCMNARRTRRAYGIQEVSGG